MTIENLIVEGQKYIHKDEVKMLLSIDLNINQLEIFNHLDKKVDNEFVEKFLSQVKLLKEGYPIQYVVGNVNFCGFKFKISQDTLIPRFETEELVEQTIKLIEQYFSNKDLSIIDLGTGSGVIGLTLKKFFPESEVTLLDISDNALEIAKENAKNLSCEINFINNDMLDGINFKYDVIISNPPYIKVNERIADSVYDYEPHLALYGGIDGLYFYKKILKNIRNNLKKKYLIAFEIGETQKIDITKLVELYLPESKIITKKDLQNRDRFIFITNCE